MILFCQKSNFWNQKRFSNTFRKVKKGLNNKKNHRKFINHNLKSNVNNFYFLFARNLVVVVVVVEAASRHIIRGFR